MGSILRKHTRVRHSEERSDEGSGGWEVHWWRLPMANLDSSPRLARNDIAVNGSKRHRGTAGTASSKDRDQVDFG